MSCFLFFFWISSRYHRQWDFGEYLRDRRAAKKEGLKIDELRKKRIKDIEAEYDRKMSQQKKDLNKELDKIDLEKMDTEIDIKVEQELQKGLDEKFHMDF